MIHKTILRKISVAIIVLSLVVISTVPVSAASMSDSAKKNMKGSYSTTQYSLKFTWLAGGFTGCKFEGTSGTKWSGSSPAKADSITHKDVIYVEKIGSISFSGGGPSVSINGGTITNKYSDKKTKQVTVNYTYKVKGILLYADFDTSAEVKFGSDFYVWGT